MPTIETKFFHFHQNNSGGYFDGATDVIIEAVDFEEANAIAESDTHIYFDGCRQGRDCRCCGDRWSRVWEEDAEDYPHMWGSEIDSDSKVKVIRYGE